MSENEFGSGIKNVLSNLFCRFTGFWKIRNENTPGSVLYNNHYVNTGQCPSGQTGESFDESTHFEVTV